MLREMQKRIVSGEHRMSGQIVYSARIELDCAKPRMLETRRSRGDPGHALHAAVLAQRREERLREMTVGVRDEHSHARMIVKWFRIRTF